MADILSPKEVEALLSLSEKKEPTKEIKTLASMIVKPSDSKESNKKTTYTLTNHNKD